MYIMTKINMIMLRYKHLNPGDEDHQFGIKLGMTIKGSIYSLISK